ncbi:MAG: NYN domain-containing protein [Acidobacteriaceae bacterium]|nr:NYN domain-containing protein [Acidobacteriaceae bacterium]
MVFIDGENLCIRCQEMLRNSGFEPIDGAYYIRDAFIWWFYNQNIDFPHDPLLACNISNHRGGYESINVIRAAYYTSMCGDDLKLEQLKERIWEIKMQPVVFKKTRKDGKAKGVDIALTKDMLVQAFFDNYDIAVLVAGDGDYVPVVEEVKRQGKRVVLQFLTAAYGLNPRLKLACDDYSDITATFQNCWSKAGSPLSTDEKKR